MAVVGKAYGLFIKSLVNKEMNINTDTLKVMLCTSQYVPDQNAHQYKSSVTNELSVVTGTLSAASTAAATTLSSSVSIPVGNVIAIDSAANLETRVVTAVTGAGPFTLTVSALTLAHASGVAVAANPGYTTTGIALTGVTTAYATKTVSIAAANVTFGATTTMTARFAVIYDSSPTTDATRGLIAWEDFGVDVSSSAGPFGITWDTTGIVTLAVA